MKRLCCAKKHFDCHQRLAKSCVEGCFCKNALYKAIGYNKDPILFAADFLQKVREALQRL
jgi:hypothetical protein